MRPLLQTVDNVYKGYFALDCRIADQRFQCSKIIAAEQTIWRVTLLDSPKSRIGRFGKHLGSRQLAGIREFNSTSAVVSILAGYACRHLYTLFHFERSHFIVTRSGIILRVTTLIKSGHKFSILS